VQDFLIRLRASVPSHDEASVVLQPGESPLHLSAVPVPAQRSAILQCAPLAVPAVGGDDFDPPHEHSDPEGVAVVGLVRDDSTRLGPGMSRACTGSAGRRQRFAQGAHLPLRGGVYDRSERST